MVVDAFTQPDPPTIERVVNDGLRDDALILLCATCEVEYDGRAAGYLGPGDRLVICKPDGTMLVHRPHDHDPVNWQPPGSIIHATATSPHPLVTARRTDPRESVTVTLHTTHAIVRFHAEDAAGFHLSGTEADMHAYIEANPHEIEPGLRIIEHERTTPHGSIDFFAHDTNGHPVIIEVKRSHATLNHVDQLRRYVSLYRESNPTARGILAAPEASDRVKRTLATNDLEFVAVDSFATTATDHTETTIDDFQ